MSDIRDIQFLNPLEREYEGWVIRGIEDYFAGIGMEAHVFALGQGPERMWKADEVVKIEGKIVGLQFKRAELANQGQEGNATRQDLFWDLPNAQLQWIVSKNSSERQIAYALPTFINRRHRRVALEHCLFWFPDKDTYTKAWYDNPTAAVDEVPKLADKDRWGFFVEQLLACDFGVRQTPDALARYTGDILSTVSPNVPGRDSLYFIWFPLPRPAAVQPAATPATP